MAAWGLADCWWRDLVLYQGGPREGMELSNNPKNVASVRIWGLYQFNWYQLNWTQRTPQVIKGSGKRVSSSSFMPSERVWGQGGHLLFQVQIWLHSICHMIPLLGIHTEEKRSERDTCTPMFIEVLFIIGFRLLSLLPDCRWVFLISDSCRSSYLLRPCGPIPLKLELRLFNPESLLRDKTILKQGDPNRRGERSWENKSRQGETRLKCLGTW